MTVTSNSLNYNLEDPITLVEPLVKDELVDLYVCMLFMALIATLVLCARFQDFSNVSVCA